MGKGQKALVGLVSLTLWDLAAANAADMPVKAPPPAPVAAYNWSGFYVGAHAGYRWADPNFSGPGYDFDTGIGLVSFPPRNESYSANGGIFGVHGGYNYMVTPSVLVGLEGDWSWGNSSTTLATSITGLDSIGDGFTFSRVSEAKLTWQATVRGRLGYVSGPWLFYGTGGVAFTRLQWSEVSRLDAFAGTFTAGSAGSKTLTGWVVGGGVEYMVIRNWIVRGEYLHENFGDFSIPFGFVQQAGKLELKDVNKVRVGLSYKFGP
jgi:outer membrane immunogenic protein